MAVLDVGQFGWQRLATGAAALASIVIAGGRWHQLGLDGDQVGVDWASFKSDSGSSVGAASTMLKLRALL